MNLLATMAKLVATLSGDFWRRRTTRATPTFQSKFHSSNDSLDVRMCTTTALRNAEMISSVEKLPGPNDDCRMTKPECRKLRMPKTNVAFAARSTETASYKLAPRN